MHRALLVTLLLIATPLEAASGYGLDLGASFAEGNLKVQPTVTGPAGKVLRYEMRLRRVGGAGTSSSNQSGTVTLGRDGTAPIASSSMTLSPRDHCQVDVRLLDRDEVVAEQSATFP